MFGFMPLMASTLTWQQAALAYGRMYVSAQEVIQRRTLQMALGQMHPEEAMRMVMEKPAAFAEAFERAALATVSGQGAADVALAAVSPISAKASANAQRLRQG